MNGFAREICAGMPGAELTHPFSQNSEDIDVWKIGGKVFAMMSVDADGVSVKCADVATADMLKEAGMAVKAPYCHASWVRVPSTSGEEEVRHRIETSYRIIRGGLTKKLQATLPPVDMGA